MDSEERLRLHREALEAIKKSTKTLEVADQLLRVGNKTEAQRLRDEARDQRNDSLQLMAKARRQSL